MLTGCVAATIWMLASLSSCQAAFDCNKHLDQYTVKCCSIPNVSFEAYRAECGRFFPETRVAMSPCLLDCIFTTEQLFKDNQLNKETAAKMVRKIIGQHEEFANVYTDALANCSLNTALLQKYKKRQFYGSYRCSQVSVFLAMCASEYVFMNCPKSSWKSSRLCETVLEQKQRCKCNRKGSQCPPTAQNQTSPELKPPN